MSLNTTIAFPYTRSNRIKDKILSEVMITTLVKSITPNDSFWVNEAKTKLVLGGYYFELPEYPRDSKYIYCFVERDGEFPQLLNYTSMAPQSSSPQFDDYECLFILDNQLSEGNPNFIYEGPQGYCYQNGSGENVYVDFSGGKCSDIPVISDIYQPFYISSTYDDSKKNKIWIKAETMNPFVYDESYTDQVTNSHWCPLGAVYKSNTN